MPFLLILQFVLMVMSLAVCRISFVATKTIRQQDKMFQEYGKVFRPKKTPSHIPHLAINLKSPAYWTYQHDIAGCATGAMIRNFFWMDPYKAYPVYIRKMYSKDRYKNYYTPKLTADKLYFYVIRKPLKKITSIPFKYYDTDVHLAYDALHYRQSRIMTPLI